MSILVVVFIGFIYFMVSNFIYPLLPFGFSEIVYDVMFFCVLFIWYFFRKE